MAASKQSAPNHRYRFGDFLLDPGARSLLRLGEPIPLTLKEFDTLVVLVECAGQAVEKDNLVRRVWPDSFVGDGSLAKNISILRKHIGADAIQTIPKHGYRFASPVSLVSDFETPKPQLFALEDSSVAPSAPVSLTATGRNARGVWVLGGGLLCLMLLGALAGLGTRRNHVSKVSDPAPTRIAVLPFRNLSGKPDSDYFSDGIVEELITTLGQVNGEQLRVLANGSSSQYRATDKNLSQIAQELNAQYLVQGTVSLLRKEVELNVHLVKGSDQSVVWAGKYTRPLQELSGIRAEISESIAREVEVRVLNRAAGDRLSIETLDPLAHDAYLHGRMDLEHKNPGAAQQALEQFRHATVLDPKYAAAYAGISETYINLANNTPTGPAYAYAKEAALTAIRLDDRLAEAHRDLAWILDNNEFDWPGAEREYRRALELNPSDARAHHWYAQYLVEHGEMQSALREVQAGLDLDPISLSSNYNYGFILIDAGRVDASISHLQHLLLREPNNEVVHGYLGIAYDRKHDFEKSAAEFQQAADASGLKKQYQANVARSLALAGKTTDARRMVSSLHEEMDKGAWMPAVNLALAYFALGEKDEGFSLLRKALQEHSCTLLEINTEPMLVDLKTDARMRALRREFHLGDTNASEAVQPGASGVEQTTALAGR
jgi:TolB-like protein/DNA-binding winged helix-turn-helix (wHTH) protein/Flp pilus assembly protein TadD